ncbi:hypothetical protein BGS_0576 [Beggiatoa sp. SS]|nr:hypothetical protein BGS_0576 [Beggiatoa sp. SS]
MVGLPSLFFAGWTGKPGVELLVKTTQLNKTRIKEEIEILWFATKMIVWIYHTLCYSHTKRVLAGGGLRTS